MEKHPSLKTVPIAMNAQTMFPERLEHMKHSPMLSQSP